MYHYATYTKSHGWQVIKHLESGQEQVVYEFLANMKVADWSAHRMNQDPVWK